MPLHYEVLGSESVDLAAVKEILKDKPKKEMTYEQKMAYENANEFVKLTKKKAEQLIAELKGLGLMKLTDEMMIKLVDLLPGTIDELKIMLANSKIAFKKKELEDIMTIVKKYA